MSVSFGLSNNKLNGDGGCNVPEFYMIYLPPNDRFLRDIFPKCPIFNDICSKIFPEIGGGGT